MNGRKEAEISVAEGNQLWPRHLPTFRVGVVLSKKRHLCPKNRIIIIRVII